VVRLPAAFGASAVLAERRWQYQNDVRIRMGPSVDDRDYDSIRYTEGESIAAGLIRWAA
jgi:hypothetical protein